MSITSAAAIARTLVVVSGNTIPRIVVARLTATATQRTGSAALHVVILYRTVSERRSEISGDKAGTCGATIVRAIVGALAIVVVLAIAVASATEAALATAGIVAASAIVAALVIAAVLEIVAIAGVSVIEAAVSAIAAESAIDPASAEIAAEQVAIA